MELSKLKDGSAGRGGLRRVEITYRRKGEVAVFVVEYSGHWTDAVYVMRMWLNNTGRSGFLYSSMRDV